MNLAKGDKVVIYSKDSRAVTAFYQIIAGEEQATAGAFQWGVTTTQAYLPLDNAAYFDNDMSLVDWLRQYAQTEEEREEVHIRGLRESALYAL